MTYEEAAGHLTSLSEARVQPGLKRISEALLALGRPHLSYPHLAVGGTNGKGSTVAFLSSILSAAGWRTGAYTSPHLLDFSERIRVGGESIPRGEFATLAGEVRDTGVDLSYFEFATALALLHFARRGVEVAVLEVGMGGRWDAVNATHPVLSVITTIALDHQRWLGATVEEIAREKAPIMRTWAPAVIGRVEGAALAVLQGEAAERQAQPFLLGREFTLAGREGDLAYRGLAWRIRGLSLGLPGPFQRDNAACALAAAELLDRQGICVREEAVREGLAAARWPARLQTFPGSPPVTLDVAHNPAGIAALVAALGPGGPPVWVFSALADKDIRGMAALVGPASSRVVLAPLAHPRAASLAELVAAFPPQGAPGSAPVEAAPSPCEALKRAREAAGPSGRVVVAGSSYLAGEVLPLLGAPGKEEAG